MAGQDALGITRSALAEAVRRSGSWRIGTDWSPVPAPRPTARARGSRRSHLTPKGEAVYRLIEHSRLSSHHLRRGRLWAAASATS